MRPAGNHPITDLVHSLQIQTPSFVSRKGVKFAYDNSFATHAIRLCRRTKQHQSYNCNLKDYNFRVMKYTSKGPP